MNYPIRALKKKLNSKNYIPHILDNQNKEFILREEAVNKKKNLAHQAVEVGVTSMAGIALFLVLISPITETKAAEGEVEELVEAISSNDAEHIAALRYDYELTSEFTSNGIVSISIEGTEEEMQEALTHAFSLTSLIEVLTDGDALRVEFKAYD